MVNESTQHNRKKGDFAGYKAFLARKPIVTLSAQISLDFSRTRIAYAVLPSSLTTAFRTPDYFFNRHT